MDSLELEFARRRKNLTRKDMANLIGKSLNTYGKKERGDVEFTDEEKVIVAKELELSPEQVNRIFFDGNLPMRLKDDAAS